MTYTKEQEEQRRIYLDFTNRIGKLNCAADSDVGRPDCYPIYLEMFGKLYVDYVREHAKMCPEQRACLQSSLRWTRDRLDSIFQSISLKQGMSYSDKPDKPLKLHRSFSDEDQPRTAGFICGGGIKLG